MIRIDNPLAEFIVITGAAAIGLGCCLWLFFSLGRER